MLELNKSFRTVETVLRFNKSECQFERGCSDAEFRSGTEEMPCSSGQRRSCQSRRRPATALTVSVSVFQRKGGAARSVVVSNAILYACVHKGVRTPGRQRLKMVALAMNVGHDFCSI